MSLNCYLLFVCEQVDIVGDKVDTEKIINSLMDENFPSLTLTDLFSYRESGELNVNKAIV
mgnify:CR=1